MNTKANIQTKSSTLVFVALSGGVDSAVVLNLMHQQYPLVKAISHKHWPESKCCSTVCIDNSRLQAQSLKVDYHIVDTMVNFTKEIVDDFVQGYEQGNTPNPCVICNQKNRFGHLLNYMINQYQNQYKHFKIATGHYAQIIFQQGRYYLKRGKDTTKDQSYMLYRLSQKQLSYCLFPLGNYEKPQVRGMAKKWNLVSAKAPDSQDICFVQDDYRNFITDYTQKKYKTGDFIDQQGKVLGRHQGIPFYNRGQRKGLGLSGGPWYVIEVSTINNTVVLGSQKDLELSKFKIKNCIWNMEIFPIHLNCFIQTRYHGPIFKGTVEPLSKGVFTVQLEQPSIDISPGQSAVCYNQDDIVLGGGMIFL